MMQALAIFALLALAYWLGRWHGRGDAAGQAALIRNLNRQLATTRQLLQEAVSHAPGGGSHADHPHEAP